MKPFLLVGTPIFAVAMLSILCAGIANPVLSRGAQATDGRINTSNRTAVSNRIVVDGQNLVVYAPRFTARFEGSRLVSIQTKKGVEFLAARSVAALEAYLSDRSVRGFEVLAKTQVQSLSDTAARISVRDGDDERVLALRLDPATGDLCVQPSVMLSRVEGNKALAAVRWNVAFAREAKLVLPCWNGMEVSSENASFPGNDRFEWPTRWTAQMAIAQRNQSSLMIHAQDAKSHFKALQMTRQNGGTTLGFDVEAEAPWDDNRVAGGVEWRLNTYEGDWKVPARRYRQWMETAYDLRAKSDSRPAWTKNVSLAVLWAASDVELLERMAKIYPPAKTVIHLSGWRSSGYDKDYPAYSPSEKAKIFVRRARELGFHVLPHTNYLTVDYKHPLFERVKNWQLRSAYDKSPQQWVWGDDIKLAYIHSGLSLWRRELQDNVLSGLRQLDMSTQDNGVFFDQTLLTQNVANGRVEGLTTIGGLLALQNEMAQRSPGLVMSGEGVTEISFQRQSFAQTHIYDSWEKPVEARHITLAHPICSYLFGRYTKLMGYTHQAPGRKDFGLATELQEKMGGLPTLIVPESGAPDWKPLYNLLTPDRAEIKRVVASARAFEMQSRSKESS